ncbi:hypothetical protein FGO68_gene3152 [Halteria grandinella]|uniref:Fatty acid desaturase domain-containing protein n=1 Tax=Halteria grandinella TaxID=5974 RepID=A0A8J8SZH9_HALGN|nr:hypothetical protein FGO68_gene3152 [Halteria grandinella]
MQIPNIGLLFASLIIGIWLFTLHHALFHHEVNPYTSLPLLIFLNHLYTGLFITAHDSIHGVVCKWPWLNNAIGSFCLMVFAGFDYTYLREEHWRHHANAGLIKDDPDFHSGNPKFAHWFLSFMLNYMSIGQVSRLLMIVCSLLYMGAPIQNAALFMAVGGISSAVCLFYFGTYLPHRPDEGELERPDNFRTLEKGDNRLTSFLKSYNFGCHSEHHANPKIPWWALYDAHCNMSD